MNLYAFVLNNPVPRWDYRGMFPRFMQRHRPFWLDGGGGGGAETPIELEPFVIKEPRNTTEEMARMIEIVADAIRIKVKLSDRTKVSEEKKDGKNSEAPKKSPDKPKVENDCTRAYDAIVYNTPALPTGGRLNRALQSSGRDVETQLSQAWKESSFNPSASAAPRSSALGMFQFLTPTARDVETRVWPNRRQARRQSARGA